MCPKKNKKTASEATTAHAVKASASSRAAFAASSVVAAPAATGLENQVGLGVDIVEIARMAAVLKRTPRFKSRVFTADEQAYCDSMASPEIHYATRFAAKEAVLKALGTGFGWGTCDPRNVEVRRNVKGRPFVALHGTAKEIARQQKITEIPISLSYTHAEAVACAMAITDDSVAPAAPEDPMIELSRQFKELRNMLDDIDDVAGEAETPGEDIPRDDTSEAGAFGEDALREGAAEGAIAAAGGMLAAGAAAAGELSGAALDAGFAANVPARAQEGGE